MLSDVQILSAEIRIRELRNTNQYPQAYDEIGALLLVETNAYESARLKAVLALTYFKDGPRHLARALTLIDEILPVLAANPRELCKALINGVAAAHLAQDTHRLRLWGGRLRMLCADKTAELTDFLGWAHLLLGYAARMMGHPKAAKTHISDAVKAIKKYGSPHGRADAASAEATCYCLLAELALVDDTTPTAEAYLAYARAVMPAGRLMHPNYVEGLILQRNGAPAAEIERVLALAEAEAITRHEHFFRFQIAEARAVTASHHDAAACRAVLLPVIRDAADARIIPVLVRLQTLLASVA